MTPRWLTAFVDLPAESYEAGAAFWSAVTGYARSPQRGDQGQFATLVPSSGQDFLRLQRLDQGPRVHLDVHVDDVDQAEGEATGLGATLDAKPYDDVTVLRSPGGFTFCLVRGTTGERPPPAGWPDGRTSYVDQVCLDVPPSRFDAELDFWAGLTGWRRRGLEGEFARVTPDDGQPLQLLLQRLDDEQDHVTAHLDLAASDRAAEVAAHEAVGATVVATFDWWTVLRDPAGSAYCITRRTPGSRPS